MVHSLETLHVKCDTLPCQPSVMRYCPIVLGVRWNGNPTTSFSDAGPKKHQCPGLNFVAHAANYVALCTQFYASPSFVQSVLWDIGMNMFLSSMDSGFRPFRYV